MTISDLEDDIRTLRQEKTNVENEFEAFKEAQNPPDYNAFNYTPLSSHYNLEFFSNYFSRVTALFPFFLFLIGFFMFLTH